MRTGSQREKALTTKRRLSPTRSDSEAALTRPFLLSTLLRMDSNWSMAGIHASLTGDSAMSLTSEGGNTIDSTRLRKGFSIVCTGMNNFSQTDVRQVVTGNARVSLLLYARWLCSEPAGP